MELTERLEETLGSSWESGDLLPVQFCDLFSRRNEIDGERRLLVAVLDDAVQCYLKNMTARNRHHRLIFNETRYWLISNSRKGLFAYENLCEALGIEPKALRAALERRRRVAEKTCARPGSLGAYSRSLLALPRRAGPRQFGESHPAQSHRTPSYVGQYKSCLRKR